MLLSKADGASIVRKLRRSLSMRLGFRLLSWFVMLLLLGSVFSAGAFAASDNGFKGGKGEKDRGSSAFGESQGRASEGLSMNMSKNMTSAMGRGPDANNVRAAYMLARGNLMNMKVSNNFKDGDQGEYTEATKLYLNSTIDYMASFLEGNDVVKLEQVKKDIAVAGNSKELSVCARDVRDIWKDASKQGRSVATKAADNKLSSVLKTSSDASTRMEGELRRLEAKGENVTELKLMLEHYRALISEAATYQRNNTNITDANERLRNMDIAARNIREANAVLKDMLTQIKQHREGYVILNGNDTLRATGNGTAVLSGDLSLSINATDAKLVIRDMAGDVKVDTSGATFSLSNFDEGKGESYHRAQVFHNLSGTVNINGTLVAVMVQGADISLSSDARGTAVFSGVGSYHLNGVAKKWVTCCDGPGMTGVDAGANATV